MNKKNVSFSYNEDGIFHRVTSDISVVIRKGTLTISDSVETGSPVETKLHFLIFPQYFQHRSFVGRENKGLFGKRLTRLSIANN